jgi:outer membrane translocation and assembly module TamA
MASLSPGRLATAAVLALVACRQMPPNAAPTGPLVEEVQLNGFEILPAEDRKAFAGDLPVRAGEVLTDESEKVAGELAIEVLQNRGHPYAQASVGRQPAGAGRVRVIITAEPGTRGFFGPVEIAGNRRVDDRLIRRRLAYLPGDMFTRRAIERSQEQIASLGLFKSVGIGAHGVDARPAVVPTRVTVEERSPWQWNLALGYAAGERLSLDARISHLNLFGSARRLDFEGRVSRIERTAQASFLQADTWHPSLAFSAQLRHQEIDERAFFVKSRGGQAAVRWQWTAELATTTSYGVALERSRVDSSIALLAGLQDGTLSAWSVDVDHTKAGQGDDASSSLLTLHVEQAGGWMPGTFNYHTAMADARHSRRLADGRLTVAGRMRYGGIAAMGGEADIPMLKRFFLGGPEEMRGWGPFEIGPLSDQGVVVGGKSLFSIAGELRAPIAPRISVAAFVEAGRVWQDPWRIRLDDLLYDAGPGVRVTTPFGVVRVDLGYQLNRLEGLRIDGEPQKHRWRINLGIGEAF